MIYHVSISAQNPCHVAKVLAEIMGGCCYPSPGPIPASWMVVSGDSVETMIEVCPAATTLQPGGRDDEQAVAVRQRTRPATMPFRFLLSVSSDFGTIQAIGAREGWLTQLVGRGAPGQEPFFNVIEFWIENTLMLELAPEDMIDSYMDLFQLPASDTLFGRTLPAYPPRQLLKDAGRRLAGLVEAFFGFAQRQT